MNRFGFCLISALRKTLVYKYSSSDMEQSADLGVLLFLIVHINVAIMSYFYFAVLVIIHKGKKSEYLPASQHGRALSSYALEQMILLSH